MNHGQRGDTGRPQLPTPSSLAKLAEERGLDLHCVLMGDGFQLTFVFSEGKYVDWGGKPLENPSCLNLLKEIFSYDESPWGQGGC